MGETQEKGKNAVSHICTNTNLFKYAQFSSKISVREFISCFDKILCVSNILTFFSSAYLGSASTVVLRLRSPRRLASFSHSLEQLFPLNKIRLCLIIVSLISASNSVAKSFAPSNLKTYCFIKYKDTVSISRILRNRRKNRYADFKIGLSLCRIFFTFFNCF